MLTINTFFVHFIFAAFASSVSIFLILLVKKGFKKHISAKWQCKLNLLFLISLAVPFIPGSFFSYLISPLKPENWFDSLHFGRGTAVNEIVTTGERTGLAYGIDWLQDFAVPANAGASEYLPAIFMGIWIMGIIAFTAIIVLQSRSLRLIKESVKPVKNKEILSLFLQCKTEAGVKDNVLLGSSVLAKTPMMAGFFKVLIILPAGKMPLNDIRYALLHELTHYKNKDIQINSVMCLFQILYWFNPLVWFVFKQMRIDRELACDASVLEMLPKKLYADYGGTLLNFVNTLSRPSALCPAADMGGPKPQIINRIRHIASYSADTYLLKVKSICIFAFMGLIVFSQIPLVSAFANNSDSGFYGGLNLNAQNVIQRDLTSFFNGLEGSFVLYDLDNSLYTIHNINLSAARVSPNSTYKIYSALIALNKGILEADNTLREWDGAIYPFEAWNQDHNLASAMHNSVNWYFQDFDVQAGKEELYYYLTHISYGNRNLSGGITDFWIESSLRISPIEQVKLLRDFHQNNTIFETEHVNTLKDVLRLSEQVLPDGSSAVLSGKTGTGFVDGFTSGIVVNGWFIGYVEKSGNTYFFATYIRGEDNAGGSVAAQITLSILADKGIY